MEDREILALLRGPIQSVRGLELLLLLRSSAPRTWSIKELVLELRSSVSQIEGACSRLAATGFLTFNDSGHFSYAPVSDALDQACAHLAVAYRERPFRVISALFSPDERLRSFADAFRIKGKDDDL